MVCNKFYSCKIATFLLTFIVISVYLYKNSTEDDYYPTLKLSIVLKSRYVVKTEEELSFFCYKGVRCFAVRGAKMIILNLSLQGAYRKSRGDKA